MGQMIKLTIHTTEYDSCVVQRLTYISMNFPNINKFHSKTSDLLSENKTLTKTLT